MLKIFIPCYNEEKAIEKNTKKVYEILSSKFKNFKLYVIDDGSKDKTSEILKRLKLKNFVYVRCNGPSRRENLVQSMCRYSKGAKIKRKLDRRIISFLFNLSVRIYFNSKIRDHECGFKFFKAKILKDLVKEMGINYERKMFWDSEMLVRAQRNKLKILEIPVAWVEGPKSALTFKKELPMIKYALKLRFRL